MTEPGPGRSRREIRRRQTRDEIVAAAWELVREQGLAGLALRDLGAHVGMKAQSLYSYFGSKHEIYDALFHQGYQEFSSAMQPLLDLAGGGGGGGPARDPWEICHRAAHAFFDFCVSDPVRYQLLFQRTIPDFTPSEESYAVALDTYGSITVALARLGIAGSDAVDLWTAVLTGLVDQQLSNDPGGVRWKRLVDRAVDMLLAEIAPGLARPAARRRTTTSTSTTASRTRSRR